MLPTPLFAPRKKNAWGNAIFVALCALPALGVWPVRAAAADDDAARLLRGSVFLSTQDKQADPSPKDAGQPPPK